MKIVQLYRETPTMTASLCPGHCLVRICVQERLDEPARSEGTARALPRHEAAFTRRRRVVKRGASHAKAESPAQQALEVLVTVGASLFVLRRVQCRPGWVTWRQWWLRQRQRCSGSRALPNAESHRRVASAGK
jgi:hypothetical protein